MPVVTAIAIYFILWWLFLFTVLPFGIRGQHESGDVVEGSEPGAPENPFLLTKVIQTSIVAGIVWLVILGIIHFNLISINDIPFLPDFTPVED